MNIDQALIALCEKHDLVSLTISAIATSTRENGFMQCADAQFMRGGARVCCSSTDDLISEAIAHAIQQVNEARACVVDVPAMELGEVAS